jgi:hypothetical protein
MADFSLEIDYGSGFVAVDMQDINLDLKNKRGEINDYVSRKELTGTFALKGSEAIAADTYFVTGGNDEAPIRLYEGVTLKYEGFAKTTGIYDYRSDKITFNSFRTDDDYTDILSVINDELIGEQLTWTGGFRRFALHGNTTNCNVLQAYNWTGTTWATTGNALALSNIGRVVVEPLGAGVAVYDNVSKEIRRYTYTAPNWSLSALGTSYFMPTLAGNGALAAYSATQIAFIDDSFNEFYTLQLATGTFTVLSQTFV